MVSKSANNWAHLHFMSQLVPSQWIISTLNISRDSLNILDFIAALNLSFFARQIVHSKFQSGEMFNTEK